MSNNKNRAACFSGGGAIGAYSVGVLKRNMLINGYDYIFSSGNSTGTLIEQMLEDVILLSKIYSNTVDKDIFSISPFDKNGKFNTFSYFKIPYCIYNYKALGYSSKNIVKLIKKYVTPEHYEYLQSDNCKRILTIAVVNLTKETVEYVTNKSGLDYDTYVKYVAASATYYPFMNSIEINGQHYADGGYIDHVPLNGLMELIKDRDDITDIDVYVNRPKIYPDADREYKFFEFVLSFIFAGQKEVSRGDLRNGIKLAEEYKKNLHIYYTPQTLTQNSLSFDPKTMREWIQLGYSKDKPDESYIFNK